MIITIDGPAGTGKSTVAKKVSEQLGFLHMDTGAFYRSLTYGALSCGLSDNDQKVIEEFAENNPVTVHFIRRVPHYFVGKMDATPFIRSPEVTRTVSLISSYPKVRSQLVEAQRKLASGVNVVCEGRDMGTNVFPNAEVKVFLTARLDVRALRRYEEMKEKGILPLDSSVETIMKEIEVRDHTDSTRAINPLTVPEKAHIIDTSDMSIDEVVNQIISYAI